MEKMVKLNNDNDEDEHNKSAKRSVIEPTSSMATVTDRRSAIHTKANGIVLKCTECCEIGWIKVIGAHIFYTVRGVIHSIAFHSRRSALTKEQTKIYSVDRRHRTKRM